MNDIQAKQFIVFTLAYATNIVYILLIGVLGFLNDSVDVNPETAILILLVGVVISIIASTYSIRKMDIKEVSNEILIRKLAITHIPALLALVGSVAYLYL